MKSYIKFLSRNKLYTVIEAVGLAVSLAFVIIIGNYAYQQLSVPRENPDYENIYEFGLPDYFGLTYGFTEILKDRVPEVEDAAQYGSQEEVLSVHGEKVSVRASYVDEGFFRIFSYYRLLSGSPESLEAATNIFVSETFANTYAVEAGDVLKLGEIDLTVVGMIENFKEGLIPYCDVIMPSKFLVEYYGYNPFDQYGSVVTFAKVKEGTSRELLYEKAENICKEIYSSLYGRSFFEKLRISRIDELYFHEYNDGGQFNNGDRNSVKIFILVGILLLLSAVFNYINLNIALIGRRSKEMATRRLLGANRVEIFLKYILESIAFTAVCFVFSLLLAELVTPVMNALLNNPVIPVRISWSAGSLIMYIIIIILVGAIVGLAPAVLASRFKPIEVIKGVFRAKSKMTFSKMFIIIQNILSVFLLALAFVMEAQYAKSLDRPMHSDIEDKYYLFAWGSADLSVLEASLQELPCVKRIGFAQGVPGFVPGGQYSVTRDGGQIMYRHYRMDSTAFNMLGIEVLKDFGAPKYNSVWFGKRAFEASGFDDGYYDISGSLSMRASNCEQVAGVVADFPGNSTNIGEEDYMIISYVRKEDIGWGGFVIETDRDHKDAARQISAVYEDFAKNASVSLRMSDYIEDYIKQQMAPTRNNMRLVEIFMLLSIIISLLGLLAMSTYFAAESSKDIAVRKVFGSDVRTEVAASVRSYMILVVVALFIGLPVAVWASGRYLEQFIWKLESYWWAFVAAGLLTLVFAFGSVIFQTLRAARTNPAAELKKE